MDEVTADIQLLTKQARNIIDSARECGRDITDAEASRIDELLRQAEDGLDARRREILRKIRGES